MKNCCEALKDQILGQAMIDIKEFVNNEAPVSRKLWAKFVHLSESRCMKRSLLKCEKESDTLNWETI